jgi:uncharacterized protein
MSSDLKELKTKWFLFIWFSISWTLFFISITYAFLSPSVPYSNPFKKYTISSIYYIIGAIGPTIATLSLLASYKDKTYRKDFWKRILYPQIGPKWLVLSTVLLPIALNMIIVLLSFFGGNPIFSFTSLVSKNGLFIVISLIGIIGIFGMLFPLLYNNISQFTEFHFRKKPQKLKKREKQVNELLEHIENGITKIRTHMKQHSWVYTAIFIGFLWSIWHIPIVFIQGSFLNDWSVSSFAFWEFWILFPIQSLIISWVFQRTGNSTFVAVSFFLADITRYFFTVPVTFQIFRFVIWCLIAVFIVLNEYVFHIIKTPEYLEYKEKNNQ